MVKINNLCITVNEHEILKNISCILPCGRITCCIGKSGAGKTTLLRSLAGLIKPSAGSIEIDGTALSNLDARTRAQKVGFVFQDFNLFAHMTVLQNCIDPLLIQGISSAQAGERAISILTQLGIAEKKDSYPHMLSGGQQQRVAIARALSLQPAMLLLDEPTAALDPENTGILIDILRELTQKGLTIVFSTQDMSFARAIADRILFMQNGDFVEQCDQPNICNDCLRIKSYLGA